MFLFKKRDVEHIDLPTKHSSRKPTFKELEDIFRNPEDDIPKKHQTQKEKEA